MNLLGLILLWFFNVFLRLFFEGQSFFGSGSTLVYTFDTILNSLRFSTVIYNILSWVNVFINLDLLANLFALTTVYYCLKFAINLAKHTISFFK